MSEPHDLIAPSELAKRLDIRMQTIYGLVSRGIIEGYGEKPKRVSESAARLALATSSGRGRQGVKRGPRAAAPPKAKYKKGDIITQRMGPKNDPKGRDKKVKFKQITAESRDEETGEVTLVWTDKRVIYEPIDLAKQLASGEIRIYNAEDALSMVLAQWALEGQDERAEALEAFMDANGIPVREIDIEA